MKYLSNFKGSLWSSIFVIFTLFLNGCASQPTIDSNRIQNVKTIAIVDIADMKPRATIGALPQSDPPTYTEILHFSDLFSSYFEVNNEQHNKEPIYTSDVTGQYDLLSEIAKKTDKKAEDFSKELSKAHPEINFRQGFLDELSSSLEKKGINVIFLDDQKNKTPYLRWDAPKPDGGSYTQVYPTDLPTVDADVVLQVSPVIAYKAASAINSYSRIIMVGVAVFNGRTKEFYGYQEFAIMNLFGKYHQYESLVKDIDIIGPELYKSLISLVPDIVGTISN